MDENPSGLGEPREEENLGPVPRPLGILAQGGMGQLEDILSGCEKLNGLCV